MRRKNVDLSTTGEVMYVDSISVHFGSREVHKDGVTLPLTPTEFGLLEFFLRRPRQAVKEKRLSTRSLRIRLRLGSAADTHFSASKKLGDAGSRIKTVWGVGYRFDPPTP